jgi:predicted MFS family arabinose efflux permease
VNPSRSSEPSSPLIPVVLFGLTACLLYGLGAGIRSDIGILLNPLAAHCGLRYKDVSFCIAVMELVFGGTQPFFGMMASRRSNRFVLILGALLLILSMVGMLLARSFFALLLCLGVIFGAGAGALAFGLILTSAIHYVGPHHAMIISGMLNAAAGMVGFVLSPALQSLLHIGGLTLALTVLGILSAALIPIVFKVTSRDPKTESKTAAAPQAPFLGTALKNPVYRLLLAGFTTCGFHMIIIESHLFSQFVSYGIPQAAASWAFSVYGIATIFGALLSGFLSTRVDKGKLLGALYGFRVIWVLFYLFVLPKTFVTAVLFSVGLGMTGDATVSPTSGIVNDHFPLAQVATLVGLLFAVHQVGAFFSAWLGGVLVAATGSYNAIWLIDAALCLMACVCSLAINPERAEA